MRHSTVKLFRRCAMAAIVIASAAFAAGGDALGNCACVFAFRRCRSAVGLSQYKGQVVMVNFWATWCGPCQQEMPLLDQMYKKYKPAGFTLIGVNVDKEGPGGQGIAGAKPVSFPVLLDPRTRSARRTTSMKCRARSSSDRKGEIRYVHRGYRPGDETNTKTASAN